MLRLFLFFKGQASYVYVFVDIYRFDKMKSMVAKLL